MVSSVRLDLEPHPHRPKLHGYTPMDLLTLAYLSVVLLILLIAPLRPPGWWNHLLFHLVVLVAAAMMKYVPRRLTPLRLVHDWYPIALLPLFYGELAFVNQVIAPGYYDAFLIPIERWLFGTQPAIYLRGWLPNRVLSEYLHLSYALYLLLVPVCSIVFYCQKRFDHFRVFVTNILLTFFFCYTIFIVFPVAGPYYTFPRVDPEKLGFVFPQVCHWFTNRGASQGAAFPSSHVAVAVNAGFTTYRLNRKLFWVVLPVVVGITLGVVYGGFHYAIDAIAGVLVGIGVGVVGPFLYRRINKLVGGGEALRAGTQG